MQKQHFTRIGNGRLEAAVQNEFERAQAVADSRNGAVKVTATITVFPSGRDGKGGVEYAVSSTYPKSKSIRYETEVRDGYIVADASPEVGINQTSLNFEGEPKNPNQAEAR